MSELYGPPCPFRAVGFTGNAGNHPLSYYGQLAVADHNGITVNQLPRGARFAPNPYMYRWMEALGERIAAGLPHRKGGRLMLPSELYTTSSEGEG